MKSFEALMDEDLVVQTSSVTPPLTETAIIDKVTLFNMLGDQEDRLQKLFKELKADRKSMVVKKLDKNQIVTIDAGTKNVRLILPKIQAETKIRNKSLIDENKYIDSMEEAYGVTPRRSLLASPRRQSISVTKVNKTKHILPQETMHPSIRAKAQQQSLTNTHDLYYLELEHLMSMEKQLPYLGVEEVRIRDLKKRYRHLEHFDKEYFLRHSKLDLSLLKNKTK